MTERRYVTTRANSVSPRAILRHVAAQAEVNMARHDGRRFYEDSDPRELMVRLVEEVKEMERAVSIGDAVEVLREAGDVMAFAAMIVDLVTEESEMFSVEEIEEAMEALSGPALATMAIARIREMREEDQTDD